MGCGVFLTSVLQSLLFVLHGFSMGCLWVLYWFLGVLRGFEVGSLLRHPRFLFVRLVASGFSDVFFLFNVFLWVGKMSCGNRCSFVCFFCVFPVGCVPFSTTRFAKSAQSTNLFWFYLGFGSGSLVRHLRVLYVLPACPTGWSWVFHVVLATIRCF